MLLCLILSTKQIFAGGPWDKSIRGSGSLNFSNSNGGKLTNAHLTWNFKVNSLGVYNGHLNITEKLDDGTMNHFQLSGDQLETFGDDKTPASSFNCTGGDLSVLVAGKDAKGMLIIAYFDPPGNRVFYAVSDLTKENPIISSTGDQAHPLPFDGRMTLDCGDASQDTHQGSNSDSASSDIYLPTVLSGSAN